MERVNRAILRHNNTLREHEGFKARVDCVYLVKIELESGLARSQCKADYNVRWTSKRSLWLARAHRRAKLNFNQSS